MKYGEDVYKRQALQSIRKGEAGRVQETAWKGQEQGKSKGTPERQGKIYPIEWTRRCV